MLHFKKIFSLLCNLSLFLNVFLAYLNFDVNPINAVVDPYPVTISYASADSKLNFTPNITGDIPYHLFYKTNSKTEIDSVAGSKLPEFLYVGTCSDDSCLPQDLNSGILKTQNGLNFYYQYFTLDNTIFNIIKEGSSTQLELTSSENNLLNNVPDIPILISPIGFTNDNTPLMQWDDVAGATGYYYRVKYNCSNIDDSNTCKSVYPNTVGLWRTSSEYQAGPTSDGVYYWQVQACNSTDNCSNWPDLSKIIIDTNPPSTPILQLPLAGAYVNGNPQQSWSSVADADHYVYESYKDTDTENPVNFIYREPNLKNNYRNVTGNQTISFYWRVKAVDTAGNESPWSELRKINVDNTPPLKPIISSPSSEQYFKTSPILNQWNTLMDSSGIKQYTVEYIYDDGHTFSGAPYRYTTTNYRYHSPAKTEQGGVTIRIRAEDNVGNIGEWSNPVHYFYDSTPPIITVNSYVTNDKTPILKGTIDDNSASISVEINGITYLATNNNNGNWTLDTIASNIADGTYDVIATATDIAGNIGTDSTTNELTIDSVAPKAIYQNYIDGTLFAGPIAYTNDLSKLTFTAEYTDTSPSSGLLKDSYVIFDAQDDHSFKFSQNGAKSYCSWRKEPNLVTGLSGDNYSLTTPENFSNCISSLADGEYYMTHQVYDNATRQDVPSITQFRDVLGLHFIIDTIDPTSTITTPTDSQYFNDTIGITGNTQDANGVSSVNLSYSPYINGICSDTYLPITTIIGDSSTSFSWSYDWTPTTEGIYCLKAAGVDIAGNSEDSSIVKNIVFDISIPQVSISLNPVDPDASNGWYKTQPTITLTQTDDNFDRIEYQWDSQTGIWTNYNDTPFKLNDEGSHVLYYRAIDKANNISPVGIKNIAWDQTDLEYGPQNISANPNPTSGSTSKIKWDIAKDNTGIDKYEVQWSLNGVNYSKTVGAGTNEVEVDKLTEGNWNVKVVAFDQSGRSKDGSINLQVDRTGPTAPTLSLAGTTAGTATLSWSAIADAKDYIIWYGNAPGSRLYGARVGNVTTYTVGGLGAGNYYFIVKAVDEAQNQGPESNEVNTGTIAGAVNVETGTPATGFTPEVLGETTTNNITPSPTTTLSSPVSDVLGVSNEKGMTPLWWWLWLLLLIPIYLILRRLFKSNRND
jgi:hypothetical protein